ncbi:MAG: hypothetical protein NZ749_01865 [bacterium]|nr:hypothetical protein [bacterium]
MVLTALNAVVGYYRPTWKLTSTDLFMCYAALTLSAIITGFDFFQLLLPSIMFPAYYQQFVPALRPLENLWPTWLRPTQADIVYSFFNGGRSVWDIELWRAWGSPILIWTGFITTLLVVMLSMNILIREQWVRHERLSFPIVQIPLTLCEDGSRQQLFRSRLFWASFIIVFSILSSNALSALFPYLPRIQIDLDNVGRYFATPFSGAAPFYISWSPFAIGLLYFVPLDVLFSCWFFFVVRKALEIGGVVYGWRAPDAGNSPHVFPFVRELVQGAWVGLSLVLIWSLRKHLATVWQIAFRKQSGEYRDLYRLAFAGLIIGFASLVAFEWIAGMRLWLAATYFLLFFISTVVMTRIFAEVGAPSTDFYFFNVENLTLSLLGSQALRAPETVLLGQCYWFNHGYRQHPMGHQLAAMKMMDRFHVHLPAVLAAVMLSMLVGIITGFVVSIAAYHSLGAATAKVNGGQLALGGWEIWNRIISWQNNPQPPQPSTLVIMGIGGSIVFSLAKLGDLWLGNPFRPIGFVFAFSYALDYNWNLFLGMWLVKLFILRFGGFKGFQRLAPIFMGALLADAMAQVVFGVISAFLGIALPVYLPPKW